MSEDGRYWEYGYDALGQVTNGTERWANHQPVGGSQFAYAFDTIGNRRTTESFVGPETEAAVYTANALNQYEQRTVPGQVLAAGTAAEEATVVVKAEDPPATRATRQGEYFWSVLPVDNVGGPFVGDVTATAFVPDEGPPEVDLTKTETHPVRVPATPEAFTYDEDGNLTADGLWTYTWDGENRLIAVESLAAIPDAAKVRVECAYDYQGRRVKKTVRGGYNGSAYTTAETTLFVYDGWNLIAELDEEPDLLRTYAWGLDLSGTMQGAGGIGGLLSVTSLDPSTALFVCFDGNGNVTALADASTGEVKARYTYDLFGNMIRQAGASAAADPIRFSTKYTDQETGLAYFGRRYYHPNEGRWLSRDPIGEGGGENLYAYVGNSPITMLDPYGLDQISICTANHPSEAYAVYWVVVDESQNPTREIKVGTIDASYRTVTLSGEFDNKQFDFWDLTRVAGDINDRFGFLNPFEERIQKGAIKLAVKHPQTPSSYPSLDEAGTWGSWLSRGKSRGNGWEYAGWIFGNSGSYTLGSFVTSQSAGTVRLWVLAPIANNPNIAGWFHNHPGGGEGTSGGDQATQRMIERLTRNDDTPNVFSSFGYALSPLGIVIKTDGSSSDVTVYP